MADLINPQTFLESIKKGSTAPVEQQTTIVTPVEDADPSAFGGLAALGATVLGATALGRRIPGVRNYFKVPKTASKVQPITVSKPVQTGDLPTATGQASELVTTGRSLVPSKSRIAEVQDVPFSYGAGYKGTNPLVGSPAFDRVMEAPFDSAPAKQWLKWLQDANRGDLKVSSGPLAGVSRQVQREELADANLFLIGPDGKPSGFLQYAMDNNVNIDRDMLLNMIKNNPINKIKKVVFDAPGDPVSDFMKLKTDFSKIIQKVPEPKRSAAEAAYKIDVDEAFDNSFGEFQYSAKPFIDRSINKIQQRVIDMSRKIPEVTQDAREFLRNFNEKVGAYNLRASPLETDKIFKSGNVRFDPQQGPRSPNYFPQYKGAYDGQYNLVSGENFTENVYVLDAKIPNSALDGFRYVEGSPHYFSNKELIFARFDDLPNPKLGGNVRHMRVSEVQSDLHSTARATTESYRKEFFSNRVNTFNADAQIQDLKRKRIAILDQLTPYTEIGRGALTRTQEQAKNRLMYQLQQIDQSALNRLARQGNVNSTTYGPLGTSSNDYVVKDLLRTMAEKNINAISIVPSPMNQSVKGLFKRDKIGNEVNYGLMDGKKLTKIDSKAAELGRGEEGTIVKSSKFSDLNESLRKIARQYGADFKQMPMPKSNPNKRFKIIENIEVAEEGADDAVKTGRKHYNKKIKDRYIYENHLSAADDLDTANQIKRQIERNGSTRGDLEVVELSPDSPRNYEMVPTLVAPNDVLKKFLLPFKAYMYEGGFVDKTNVFKSIL